MTNRPKEKKNRSKARNVLISALFVISLCIFVFSCLQIVSYFLEGAEQDRVNTEMIEEGILHITPLTEDGVQEDATDPVESSASLEIAEPEKTILTTPDIAVDFSKFETKYPGVIGWLYMQSGAVNAPIMQSDDNEYYVYRLPNGTENSAGSLFMDYRCPSSLTGWNHIIYGHDMKNDTMFGFLSDYRKAGYFEENPYMFYFTPEKTYRVELFAGIYTDVSSLFFNVDLDDGSKSQYLNDAKQKSLFTANVSVSAEDPILVLSTCAGAVGGSERFMLMGKLVEIS